MSMNPNPVKMTLVGKSFSLLPVFFIVEYARFVAPVILPYPKRSALAGGIKIDKAHFDQKKDSHFYPGRVVRRMLARADAATLRRRPTFLRRQNHPVPYCLWSRGRHRYRGPVSGALSA